MRYRLEKLIADSGSAMVFAATDTQLERPVVIKMLPPLLAAHPANRRRFIREARSTATVNHPNLVTIYDVVLNPNGAFIVMEHLEGRSLHRLIPRGGLAPAVALNLATQIVEALAAIHASGLVHRDVKPANIMVTPDGWVKLIDFGTATSIGRRARRPSRPLTENGLAHGTPGYMSPEQLRGERVDHRADVFSFGVTFYEMLTGTRPFERRSFAETVAAILRDQPASPRKRPSPGIVQILRRCLAKEPRRRYGSMRRLSADLQRVRQSLLRHGPGTP